MIFYIKVDVGGKLWLYLKGLLLGHERLSCGLGVTDDANVSSDGKHSRRGEVWKPHGRRGMCLWVSLSGVGLSDQKSVRAEGNGYMKDEVLLRLELWNRERK